MGNCITESGVVVLSKKEILLIGFSGQLGMSIYDAFESFAEKADLYYVGHEELDVTNDIQVEDIILRSIHKWDCIINCAAIHDIALCEANEKLSYEVNRAAYVALAAAGIRAKYIYISTDMVFSQIDSDIPIGHFNVRMPGNQYAATKAAGEEHAIGYGDNGVIIRISTLFGRHPCRGKQQPNLIERIAQCAEAGKEFWATTNRVAITSADWAAQKILQIALDDYPYVHVRETESGREQIQHLVSSNVCNYVALAQYIYHRIGADIDLVKENTESKNSFPLLADDCRGATWQEMVKEYLEARKGAE